MESAQRPRPSSPHLVAEGKRDDPLKSLHGDVCSEKEHSATGPLYRAVYRAGPATGPGPGERKNKSLPRTVFRKRLLSSLHRGGDVFRSSASRGCAVAAFGGAESVNPANEQTTSLEAIEKKQTLWGPWRALAQQVPRGVCSVVKWVVLVHKRPKSTALLFIHASSPMQWQSVRSGRFTSSGLMSARRRVGGRLCGAPQENVRALNSQEQRR